MTKEDYLTQFIANPRAGLICYLSDAMTESEREAFELMLIEDRSFSDAIEAAEFDLVEDYAAGVLSSSERRQIAKWIDASPERKVRVLLSQALHRSSSKRRRSISWTWSVIAVSTCTAMVVALSLFPHRLHPPSPSATSSRTAEVAPQIASSFSQPDTILLTAERLRGNAESGSQKTYPVHTDRPTRLQIMVPPAVGKAAYFISLKGDQSGAGGSLHFSNIKPQGTTSAPYLELTLPPKSFPSGGYILELQSRENQYRLTFRVKIE